MAPLLPPPSERFDPITARWLTPGGPLHDPERGDADAAAGPVALVGPVPPELAGVFVDGQFVGQPARRTSGHRGAMLAVFLIGAVAIVVAGAVAGLL